MLTSTRRWTSCRSSMPPWRSVRATRPASTRFANSRRRSSRPEAQAQASHQVIGPSCRQDAPGSGEFGQARMFSDHLIDLLERVETSPALLRLKMLELQNTLEDCREQAVRDERVLV